MCLFCRSVCRSHGKATNKPPISALSAEPLFRRLAANGCFESYVITVWKAPFATDANLMKPAQASEALTDPARTSASFVGLRVRQFP